MQHFPIFPSGQSLHFICESGIPFKICPGEWFSARYSAPAIRRGTRTQALSETSYNNDQVQFRESSILEMHTETNLALARSGGRAASGAKQVGVSERVILFHGKALGHKFDFTVYVTFTTYA
jgi:hypothetical protein